MKRMNFSIFAVSTQLGLKPQSPVKARFSLTTGTVSLHFMALAQLLGEGGQPSIECINPANVLLINGKPRDAM